ncbi:hypothetical protein [Streptomyces sp. NPDC000994]
MSACHTSLYEIVSTVCPNEPTVYWPSGTVSGVDFPVAGSRSCTTPLESTGTGRVSVPVP